MSLSRQKCVCRDKTRKANTSFVSTKYACRDKIMFVFCRDKSFVATSILLSRKKRRVLSRQTLVCLDKSKLTKLCLSRQAYFCCDKRRVLSRQRTCSVPTHMTFVTSPASDTHGITCRTPRPRRLCSAFQGPSSGHTTPVGRQRAVPTLH